MGDIADDAQAAAELFGGAALAATLAAARTSGRGAEDCRCCGEPIPAARRAAKPDADTCAPCQEDVERLGRRVG